jgi:hypothetical protein
MGLILASLVFLVVALMVDTVSGGPARRPDWMVKSRTYKLLNATSAGIADFVDRRRRGFLLRRAHPARRLKQRDAVMTAPHNAEILRLTTAIPHDRRLADPMASRAPLAHLRQPGDRRRQSGRGRAGERGWVAGPCLCTGSGILGIAGGPCRGRPSELAAARDRLTDWLASGQEGARLAGAGRLAPALPYTARHPRSGWPSRPLPRPRRKRECGADAWRGLADP